MQALCADAKGAGEVQLSDAALPAGAGLAAVDEGVTVALP